MFIYTDDVLIAVNISSCLLFPGLQLSEETPLLYSFTKTCITLFFCFCFFLIQFILRVIMFRIIFTSLVSYILFVGSVIYHPDGCFIAVLYSGSTL